MSTRTTPKTRERKLTRWELGPHQKHEIENEQDEYSTPKRREKHEIEHQQDDYLVFLVWSENSSCSFSISCFWCGPSTHLVSFLSRVFGVVRELILLVFYLVFTPSFWCGVLILLVFYLVFIPSFWCGVLILLVFYLVFLVWSEYSSC
jgi:hypothetical protein